jgi:hypothetical protein
MRDADFRHHQIQIRGLPVGVILNFRYAKLEWERLVRTERCNPKDPWHAYDQIFAFIRGSLRVHSRLVFIRVAAHIAQRGKVRDTSVNARSNLRQFGSNRSTNLQNRIE